MMHDGSMHVRPVEQGPPTEEKPDQERAVREGALDRTIENSFPASDPPSSIPNPYDLAVEQSDVRFRREAPDACLVARGQLHLTNGGEVERA
jgi:hypothetical protein